MKKPDCQSCDRFISCAMSDAKECPIVKKKNKVAALKAVATAAMALLQPPYYRGRLSVIDDKEAADWAALRTALEAAGYSWEEFT